VIVVAVGVAAMVASDPGRVGPGSLRSVRLAASSPRVPSRPEFAWGGVQQGAAVRSSQLAQPSRCTAGHRPGSYPWPVKPFDVQHPIRAFFGDPRTVFRNADDADVGAFSFHNGVDIVAADGTPVYPVLSGTVTRVKPDEIVVTSDAGARTFQYWHLRAMVLLHEHVRSEQTVLGAVQPERGHVHLSEIDRGVVENPLQPGHLTPYQDDTPPSVGELYFRDRLGRKLSPEALTGSVDITAAAVDTPPLPLRAPWSGVPVTPARVSWQLRTLEGRELLPEQTPADFLVTIPPPERFWSVYAPGTYQNFPAVGEHYFYGTPGDYLFDLTPSPLDTKLLRPGRYRLTVVAADTCGNRGMLSEEIRVLPQPGVTPLTGPMLTRLARHGPAARLRWPRRFWTVVIATLPAAEGLVPARTVASHALNAHFRPVGLLATSTARRPRSGHYLLFTGLFHSWARAYTAAQHAAPHFPGAHPLQIMQRPRPRLERKRRPRG
jgi:hypothetical protein